MSPWSVKRADRDQRRLGFHPDDDVCVVSSGRSPAGGQCRGDPFGRTEREHRVIHVQVYSCELRRLPPSSTRRSAGDRSRHRQDEYGAKEPVHRRDALHPAPRPLPVRLDHAATVVALPRRLMMFFLEAASEVSGIVSKVTGRMSRSPQICSPVLTVSSCRHLHCTGISARWVRRCTSVGTRWCVASGARCSRSQSAGRPWLKPCAAASRARPRSCAVPTARAVRGRGKVRSYAAMMPKGGFLLRGGGPDRPGRDSATRPRGICRAPHPAPA